VLLASFLVSLMLPTIFALGIKELGPNTKLGGSLMVIIGGAVFPPIEGLVFGATRSMATAMAVLLLCYAFIAHYGFVGCKVREPQALG